MTGFRGRTGIYEIIVVDDAIRPLIVQRGPPPTRSRQAALQTGMRTLRDDGWSKVLAGVTTIEEVLRVTEDDEALTETWPEERRRNRHDHGPIRIHRPEPQRGEGRRARSTPATGGPPWRSSSAWATSRCR